MSAAQLGFVLAFHSRNVGGPGVDDHVALAQSLSTLAQLHIPVLRLIDAVTRMQSSPERLPPRYACVTFDDGTDYDWMDVAGPNGHVHEPFGAILQRHNATGTAFVIASPEARREIMRPLEPVRMSEHWWADAQRSGIIDIGIHGWDHVHPSVSELRATPELIERFDRVATVAQAEQQIDRAIAYVGARAGPGSGRVFAYPYGQVSDFLADTYFPSQQRITAAFTTAGAPVQQGMDRWRLPRFVSGWHWRTAGQLRRLLTR